MNGGGIEKDIVERERREGKGEGKMPETRNRKAGAGKESGERVEGRLVQVGETSKDGKNSRRQAVNYKTYHLSPGRMAPLWSGRSCSLCAGFLYFLSKLKDFFSASSLGALLPAVSPKGIAGGQTVSAEVRSLKKEFRFWQLI